MTSDEILSLFHPDFQENLVESIRQLNGKLDSNGPSVFNVRTKDNHWIWIMATSSVYENNPDGSFHYLLASANEIDILGLNLHLVRLAEKAALIPHEELYKLISVRERKILQLIANGNTDKEIAEVLNISIHTAKTHRKKIIHKLGLKNSRTLIKYAFQNGLD
jgi:DNA-binding CsgD family transcriptional regulator